MNNSRNDTRLRIAVSIGYILVIVSEMLAGYKAGLGASVEFAKQSFQYEVMFAYIFAICLIGLAFNLGLAALEKRLLFWLPANHRPTP